MSRTFQRLVLVLLTIAAVALAAAPAGAASASSDAKVAKAGTIVVSDLGTGFTSSPADVTADKTLEKLAKKVKGCEDYIAVRKSMDTAIDAQSPDFESSAEQISNHVYVFENESAAKKVIKQAESTSMADCFTALFTKVVGLQVKGDTQVAGYRALIEDVPGLADVTGDEAVGYSGGIEVKGTDGSVDQLVVSTLLVRVGPTVITYSYSTLPNRNTNAFDTALNNSVLRTQIALES